jgi:glycosyltransferase involved in cell wall biosynthesis
MKVVFFANRMPDMCGAFLHDIDLATELQNRGHQIAFLIIQRLKEGYNGSYYRGFRFLHYTAGTSVLESGDIWICPHSPILPDVRKINARGYNRPLIATCHFDGNYNAIAGNYNPRWNEMLMFINRVMEGNYRRNISPWPSNVVRTEVVRPLMHRNQIEILEPFQGDCLTLVNANKNKGVVQFIDLARRMPERKFLGVLPYYGELQVPDAPRNVEWIGFDDDIRNILKRTRILLFPSNYESFGRIAVEAMLNRIPVIYSKPTDRPTYPGGSTEGVAEWIGDAAIAADRESPQEWIDAICKLDDSEFYNSMTEKGREHIESMNIFTEGARIAGLVESFSRENPVIIKSYQQKQQESVVPGQAKVAPMVQPSANLSFSSGRLKIRR